MLSKSLVTSFSSSLLIGDSFREDGTSASGRSRPYFILVCVTFIIFCLNWRFAQRGRRILCSGQSRLYFVFNEVIFILFAAATFVIVRVAAFIFGDVIVHSAACGVIRHHLISAQTARIQSPLPMKWYIGHLAVLLLIRRAVISLPCTCPPVGHLEQIF